MLVLTGDLGIPQRPRDRDGPPEVVRVGRPERRDRRQACAHAVGSGEWVWTTPPISGKRR